MKVFLCFSFEDADFVCRVLYYLKKQPDFQTYCFAKPIEEWRRETGLAVPGCDTLVFFHGKRLGIEQTAEILAFVDQAHVKANVKANADASAKAIEPLLVVRFAEPVELNDPRLFTSINSVTPIKVKRGSGALEDLGPEPTSGELATFDDEACRCAQDITVRLVGADKWIADDGLPIGYPFGYEKHVIEQFARGDGKLLSREWLEQGCPLRWPDVEMVSDERKWHPNPVPTDEIGAFRKNREDSSLDDLDRPAPGVAAEEQGDAASPPPLKVCESCPEDGHEEERVIVDVRTVYHRFGVRCLQRQKLTFLEAGPRKVLAFPAGIRLKIGIVVSGGIAPGINAVISGIVERHRLYQEMHGKRGGSSVYNLEIFLYHDGLSGVLGDRCEQLGSNDLGRMRGQSNLGGSMIGTSRHDVLLDISDARERDAELNRVVEKLYNKGIHILYVIGGDGSMRAAHAIWTRAKAAKERHGPNQREIAVVAIPKTMDNDILWVWQSFGFLSAAEKAKEFILQLHTEVKSNPRLCIVQLFGSDSGFVVSHAALASGSCTAALIPEVDFSMERLSKYLCGRLQKEQLAAQQHQSPYGIVLLAETAIPQDVEEYIDSPSYPNLHLHEDERAAIREFVGSSLLNMKDIGRERKGQDGNDWAGFYAALAAPVDTPEAEPRRVFWDLLPEYLREIIQHFSGRGMPPSPLDALVLNALNSILRKNDIPWDDKREQIVLRTASGADVLGLLKRIRDRVQEIAKGTEPRRPDGPAAPDGDFEKDMKCLQSLPVSYEAIELAKVLQDGRNRACMSPRERKRILDRIAQRLVEKRNRLLMEACFPGCIREARRLPGGRHVHGQTQDELRTGGLKIVAHVLQSDLRNCQKMPDDDQYWRYYRVFTNEPRHLLRAIAPSVSDVVFGQRLGTLAVDNAMAGYTDFMVSQWLTEYVLVPLKLVVLGRKRVPQNGIFWKSVLATTGQDAEMLWERQHQDGNGPA